ncbi:MAG: hypothetical protein ACRDH8_01460 [Actinomycetota bacterium]
MPTGSHRARRTGIRLPVIAAAVAILVLLGGGAWLFFFREGGNPFTGEEVAEFSFQLGKVGGAAATTGETASKEEMGAAAEDVRETLDAMYVAGFIDPSKWENGAFTEVLEAFTDDARRRAARDLPNLTLGDDAGQVASVAPDVGRLSIRFLVAEGGELTAAVAATSFAAGGELKDGRPLIVQHRGSYYMHPGDDGWEIVGYQVRGIVTTGTTGQGPPEETPS